MPIINVTPEMLEAGKPWGAGWHKATLVEVKEELSKAKDSTNLKPVLEYGWTSDGSRVNGKILSEFAALMNNKNLGAFARNFLPFAAAVTGEEVTTGSIDLDRCKGTEIWVEISAEVYNGQIQDRVTGWADRRKVPF